MRLLVTRPSEDSERLGIRLRELGHEAVIAPLLEIEPVPATLPNGPYAGIVFTSRHAVRALAGIERASDLRRSTAWCVGRSTAEAATLAGFDDVVAGSGTARDLARLVAASATPAALPVLHVRGHDTREDLGSLLEPAGIRVDSVVVYRAKAATVLPEAARIELESGRLGGVILLSPRSSKTLLRLAADAGLMPSLSGLTAFCISEATAAPLQSLFREVQIAQSPELDDVLDLIRSSESM